MAAELTTGALVMFYIKRYDIKLSMLVVETDAVFTKKATGLIRFTCNQGQMIKQAVKSALKTGDPQTIWVESIGRNQVGEEVSRFRFKWSLRLKR